MLSAIFGGITSLGGLLSANSAAKRAEQQRQQALLQMTADNNQMYANALNGNNRTLQQAAGVGGDAIASLGRNLGDSLAGAGVYNSSATAGALASAQRGTDTALANQAAQLQLGSMQQHQQGMLDIDRLGLGVAGDNVNYARQGLDQARGGLGSFLGTLAQSNLMRSGANVNRNGQQQMNGTINQGPNLPGNNPFAASSILDKSQYPNLFPQQQTAIPGSLQIPTLRMY